MTDCVNNVDTSVIHLLMIAAHSYGEEVVLDDVLLVRKSAVNVFIEFAMGKYFFLCLAGVVMLLMIKEVFPFSKQEFSPIVKFVQSQEKLFTSAAIIAIAGSLNLLFIMILFGVN